MTQSEKEKYLDDCEAAFQVFCERFPDYPQTEAHARMMAAELRRTNLSPDSPGDLAIAWQRIRPAQPAPQSAPAVAPQDPIDVEARRLISEGRISKASIDAMSSEELARATSSAVFNRVLEILEPPKTASPLTHGDYARISAEAARTGQDAAVLTWETVRAVEQSRRDNWTSINQDAPAVSTPPAERSQNCRACMMGTCHAHRTRNTQTADEARRNEALNAKRAGRGMRSLSAHERQGQ